MKATPEIILLSLFVAMAAIAGYLTFQGQVIHHSELYQGMSYEQAVQHLGQPVDDIGVNIHIYVWESSRIYATFSLLDNRLIAAIQVLPDGQLWTLVEP